MRATKYSKVPQDMYSTLLHPDIFRIKVVKINITWCLPLSVSAPSSVLVEICTQVDLIRSRVHEPKSKLVG
jgi:hypothetical protein